MFLVFLPLLVERFGLSTAQKGLAFVPLTAGILAGITFARRRLGHWASDRIIRASAWGLGATVLVLWLVVASATLSLALLVAAMTIYGSLLGASLPAQSTLLVGLFSADRATAMGLHNFARFARFARFAGAAAGPLLGAVVVEAFGDAAMLCSLWLLLLVAAYPIPGQQARCAGFGVGHCVAGRRAASPSVSVGTCGS